MRIARLSGRNFSTFFPLSTTGLLPPSQPLESSCVTDSSASILSTSNNELVHTPNAGLIRVLSRAICPRQGVRRREIMKACTWRACGLAIGNNMMVKWVLPYDQDEPASQSPVFDVKHGPRLIERSSSERTLSTRQLEYSVSRSHQFSRYRTEKKKREGVKRGLVVPCGGTVWCHGDMRYRDLPIDEDAQILRFEDEE
ncbi:hypothetical protein L210DRAFT_3546401 [Boletus edulis BED1]|uniref:Uncharacterized protein n=1 Tax=Boletus edulis BED1 TaxID=1328754 RepID=A0AAD4BQI1_BOLED|nr:hypothetical protein L210DRAFT_3546401 [Boletus edulis BED1]